MASSYTSNSGIEKPAEGDQTGEWGDTVNTNMDIIDRSINGVGAITLSGTTHTLTTTDGTLSDGMYKVLVLGGSPSGTNTITIAPNDADKVYIVVNSSGQTATFTQGSGGNVSVLNGDSKIIYADGNGTGAAVVDVTADLSFSSVNIDGGTIDGTVIGGASAAAGTFTTVTASGEIDGASLDISGNADIDGTLETDALSIASTTVTSTAAELNLLDGSSAGSVVNSKAVIYSSGGVVNATDVAVSGSGARSITITSSDNIASMEIGSAASNAAFIDLKTPSSDDFDMRISSESGGSGGFLQVASGNLTLTGSGKTSAVFDGDGAVSLYHNNSVKIATASGGITVTGEVAATSLDISGDADIDGTLEADAMTLNGTAITTTATLSTGISNTNVPVFTTGVADDDFLRVAGTSIEGRSAAEVLSDIGASAAAGSGSIVTTGALNSGSITSGFGTINNGSSAITTTGLISGGSLDIDDVVINGSTIGHTDDTDLITVADGIATVAGEVSMTTLDIGGTNVTSTAAELNYNDTGAAVGTVVASKTVTADANKDITGFRNVTLTGELDAGSLDVSGNADIDGTLETDALSIASTVVTATAAELNYLDITTLGTTQASKAVTTDSNGDVVFPDGDKINFGTGSDLVLQHDGSNAYIQNSTGNINLQAKSGESSIVAIPDGAVTLYHDNAAKLATTATGADITGAVTASTFEPDSDTTAGDNAAIGYTSAEGLILTGQGSTSDVTIKNDADATVLSIATGTTKVGVGTTGNLTGYVNLPESDYGEGFNWFSSGTAGNRGGIGHYSYESRIYYGSSDNLTFVDGGPSGTERMRIAADGKVGIGTTAPTRTLTVIGSVGNQFVGSQSQSNDTAKYATYAGSHYHNAEQDVAGLVVLSDGTNNTVYLGGGIGECNAATVLAFITDVNDAETVGTERMRITSAGKVGIGTTAPGAMLQVHSAALGTTAGNTQDILQLHSPDVSNNTIYRFLNYRHSSGSSHDESELRWQRKVDVTDQGYIGLRNQAITFGYGTTERMRMRDNGQFLVNQTSIIASDNAYLQVTGGSVTPVALRGGTNNYFMAFYKQSNNDLIGSITGSTGSTTSFNTSSDYRLKENVDYSWDATTRLKQLKPARFNFIADPDNTVDGFIAHEVQEVVPHAVTGVKDGEEMQGIDHSKLVPLLTASLQEALKRIDSLEEQVNALKGK